MPGRDLDLLIDAARQAGDIALRYFRNAPKVWEKPDDAGPVTEADLAINEMLLGVLRDARPDYGWLSEESPDDPARLETRRCFIVDPLDGTRAFIDGQSGFAHSLAIADQGQVTAGVVYLPELGLLYTATADGPATCNGQALVPTDGTLDGASLLGGRNLLDATHWQGGVAPAMTRAFRPSLAWRLCLIAEGRFDVTLSLRRTWEWDVAAGCLIARRAGCGVSDMLGAAPLFNNSRGFVDGIVVAGPQRQAEIIGRLAHRSPARLHNPA